MILLIIRIKSNIGRETAALIEEHRPNLSGVVVLTESQRSYKFDSLGFHVLGYVGEISENELALKEGYKAAVMYAIGVTVGLLVSFDNYHPRATTMMILGWLFILLFIAVINMRE